MLENIINRIKELRSGGNVGTVLIGIDGGGGSGKSTLANEIASYFDDVYIIHMDDFYKPSAMRNIADLSKAPVGYEFDIDRLLSQIVEPYMQKKNMKYQKYDWENDCLLECEDIAFSEILIIEGCYSNVAKLNGFYNIKIFVDCREDIRLKRGLARDGESALPMWINWMNGENKYFSEQNPKSNTDFVFVSDV